MDTKQIFEVVARDHNTTPEVVENEIRRAIREAMQCKDPKARMLWKQISPNGEEPSIETFLQFVVDRINEKRGKGYKQF